MWYPIERLAKGFTSNTSLSDTLSGIFYQGSHLQMHHHTRHQSLLFSGDNTATIKQGESEKNNHGKSGMELRGFHTSQVEITHQKQQEKLHLGWILGQESPPVFRKNTNVYKKDLHKSRHEIKQILL